MVGQSTDVGGRVSPTPTIGVPNWAGRGRPREAATWLGGIIKPRITDEASELTRLEERFRNLSRTTTTPVTIPSTWKLPYSDRELASKSAKISAACVRFASTVCAENEGVKMPCFQLPLLVMRGTCHLPVVS